MSKYKSNSMRVCEAKRKKTKKGWRWFFHVKRRENGEIIAPCGQSQGYHRKIDCISTAKLVTGGRLKITIIK